MDWLCGLWTYQTGVLVWGGAAIALCAATVVLLVTLWRQIDAIPAPASPGSKTILEVRLEYLNAVSGILGALLAGVIVGWSVFFQASSASDTDKKLDEILTKVDALESQLEQALQASTAP